MESLPEKSQLVLPAAVLCKIEPESHTVFRQTCLDILEILDLPTAYADSLAPPDIKRPGRIASCTAAADFHETELVQMGNRFYLSLPPLNSYHHSI